MSYQGLQTNRPNPIPHAAITFNPDTGLYGFRVWMPGRRPHDEMDTFRTEQAARDWCDPQREREWEESDEPGLIAISREFKPGSVPTRL